MIGQDEIWQWRHYCPKLRSDRPDTFLPFPHSPPKRLIVTFENSSELLRVKKIVVFCSFFNLSGIDRNMCCGTHVSNLSQVQVRNVEISYTSLFNPTVKCDPIRKHIQTLGSLNNYDGDGNKNGKNAIGLDQQNNNFARASCLFVHFFAVTAPTTLNVLISRFVEDGSTWQRFSFSFCELRFSPLEFNSWKKSPTFDKLRVAIRAMKFETETAQIHFLGAVFVAVAVFVV